MRRGEMTMEIENENENDLLGYLLQLDDAETLKRVEDELRRRPQWARRIAALKQALEPLEADRDLADPPADLVNRTMGFVAAHIVRNGQTGQFDLGEGPSAGELLRRMPPERLRRLMEVMDRAATPPSRSRRIDIAAVAAVLLVTVGVTLAAIPYLRQRHNMLACQNRMRELYAVLQNYSDTHDGRIPQVTDAPPHNTGSSFVTILREAGALPDPALANCPVAEIPGPYAYSLGWRDREGNLYGLRRQPEEGENDMLPILADRPPDPRDGTPSPDHRTGQNVLFMGGHVRFATDYNVGVNRDNIYRNYINQINAGLSRHDTVLGTEFDRP
jgi:hypothetical protein